MKIVLFTNTYLPHVGGVARSVDTLRVTLQGLGHQVHIVAPEFPGGEDSTDDVLRVPAFQNFNGSDFSVRIPLPGGITDFLDDLEPDVIHTHHPFLLGDTGLRAGWGRRLPVVFTHHTLYERYTHYVGLHSEPMRRVATQLAVEYSNLCTAVIAPSESVARLLRHRGVTVPIESIPTGVDREFFGRGNGPAFREKMGIPADALVAGHVGRLAPEKNLDFLGEALGRALADRPQVRALVVGEGRSAGSMLAAFTAAGGKADSQWHHAGRLSGQDLADAYAAMDVFCFTSQSETQGMVLAEAMAAGKPVIALDGPGVREIVRNDENGRLLEGDASAATYAEALGEMLDDDELRARYAERVPETAAEFSQEVCARKVEALYTSVISSNRQENGSGEALGPLDILQRRIEIEWNLLAEKANAAAAALEESEIEEVK